MFSDLLLSGFLLILGLIAILLVYYLFLSRFQNRNDIYQEAMQLAKNGKYIDARGILRRRLSKNPDDPLAHFYISQIYSLEKNVEQEYHHLKELERINVFPSDLNPVEIFLRAGHLSYERNELSDAFRNFLNVLKFDPQNEIALAYVAFLAIGQGEFETAENYFSSLVYIAPQVKEYYIARGVGLAMLKKNHSIQEFNKALRLEPKDQTTAFLKALECFRQREVREAYETLTTLIEQLKDVHLLYIANKLMAAVCYLNKDYTRAREHAEYCLKTSVEHLWEKEAYDAHLSVAYLAILTNTLSRVTEVLLELEIRNPLDKTVLALADFRMDLENNRAVLDKTTTRHFNFMAEMQDWLRDRFPDKAIYTLSGLAQSKKFDVLQFFVNENQPATIKMPRIEAEEILDSEVLNTTFNDLDEQDFRKTCEKIVETLGFTISQDLKYREPDGIDYLGQQKNNPANTALFRIRKWINQPISDIFLREQQSFMNEKGANLGFVIAGAKLTPGAKKALQSLKKITIINENQLTKLLQRVI